jgi:antitoxin component of RelBE/YafQ-DinJ toxin-antitoxin module
MADTPISIVIARSDLARAEAILAKHGITVAEYLRLVIERLASRERSPLIPNAETVAGLDKRERGEVKPFVSLEEFWTDFIPTRM